eukprot:816108-Rhodomonas_salina.1
MPDTDIGAGGSRRMHTAQLKLSVLGSLNLTDIEWISLALPTHSGGSVAQYCIQEVCTCTFRWVAAPLIGFQHHHAGVPMTPSQSGVFFVCAALTQSTATKHRRARLCVRFCELSSK